MDRIRELEQKLKETEDRLEKLQRQYDFLLAAVDHLPNPIFMKDEDAKFFFFNKVYSEFFNMRRSDYIGKTVLDLDYLPMEAREQFQREDLERIRTMDVISYDTTFPSEAGEERPSFYWSRGFMEKKHGRHGLVGEIVDITKERELQKSLDRSMEQLRQVNDQLREMAERDEGTGLYNRIRMREQMENLGAHKRDREEDTCALMADLDYFKVVNDRYGHLMGDEILARFADILKSECRSCDMPIRYGGDEFILFLSGLSLEDGISVAERIRARCEKELCMPDGAPITTSIGVTKIDNDLGLEWNIAVLDQLLYEAKRQGRNRVISSECEIPGNDAGCDA